VAEENEAQEKTEEPTQRRLEKAREDGEILASKEMMVLASSMTGLAVMAGATLIMPTILGEWRDFFRLEAASQLAGLTVARSSDAMLALVLATLLVGAPVIVGALATQAGVGGLNFSGKALAFKGSRISPLAGLKRIFSVRGLAELVKSIAKVGLLGAVAATVIWYMLPSMIDLSKASLGDAAAQTMRALGLLTVASVLVLAAIGLADFLWSRHQHMQKLRMSRQDLKDEHKQSEGSPEVRMRIRRLQMEASRRSAQAARAIDSVAEARVIITNPTHFAVALRYDHGEAGAPVILAMGRGHLAQEIITRGTAAGVSVLRSPLLARALYFTGEIGQEITERLYAAVAVVLAYVYRIDQGEALSEPEIDLPEDLRFSEDGRPLGKRDA
jgi:flagellar biosynthetic protein FlhB